MTLPIRMAFSSITCDVRSNHNRINLRHLLKCLS